jgi:hypothetical protein
LCIMVLLVFIGLYRYGRKQGLGEREYFHIFASLFGSREQYFGSFVFRFLILIAYLDVSLKKGM